MVLKSINDDDDDANPHDIEAGEGVASSLGEELPPPVAPPDDEVINEKREHPVATQVDEYDVEEDGDIVFEPIVEAPAVLLGYVDCHLCYAEGSGEVSCSEHHFFCTSCMETHLQKALRIGGMYESTLTNKAGTVKSEVGQVPCPLFFSEEEQCSCAALSEEVFLQYADPILWRRAQGRVRHSMSVREAEDAFKCDESKLQESPSHRSDSVQTFLMSDRFTIDADREDLVKKTKILTVSFLFVALTILSMMLPSLLGRFVCASLLTALVTWVGTKLLCVMVDSNAAQEVGVVQEVVWIGTPIEVPYLAADGRWAPYRTMLLWALLAITGYGLLLTFWPEPNEYRWVQPIGPCLLMSVALNFGGGLVVVNWSRPRRGSFHWQHVRMLVWSAFVLPIGVYWVLYDDGFFSTWGWRSGVIATTFASLFLGAETYVLALAEQAQMPKDLVRAYVCAAFWACGVLLVFLVGNGSAEEPAHAGVVFGSVLLVLPFVLIISWFCRDRRQNKEEQDN